jgi:hypothetical protein
MSAVTPVFLFAPLRENRLWGRLFAGAKAGKPGGKALAESYGFEFPAVKTATRSFTQACEPKRLHVPALNRA